MTPLAARIVDLIHTEQLAVGAHLPAQMLADRLRVSRQPVNDALALLAQQRILTRQPNRGYFVAQAVGTAAAGIALGATDTVTSAYFQMAEDRLRGALADEFSESSIKARYGLTAAQLNTLLARIAQEGWAEKNPGYGWSFSSMLTTPDSLLQSYELRLALEPAALLQPGYRVDQAAFDRCRAAELHLLDGGIETDTPDQLHDRGVRFHETIVAGCGNPFFIDTIRRVNRVRRLLSYRSMQDRSRYRQHCKQHLRILDLLERQRNEEASVMLRSHLMATVRNLKKIRRILAVDK